MPHAEGNAPPFGSLTVVGLGSLRGDADGWAGACLGCGKRPREATLERVSIPRPRGCDAHRFVVCSRRRASTARQSGKRQRGSAAAIAAGQSGDAAALSASPGKRGLNADDAPPADTFAPSRIGATPRYGSADASGAAKSGFDSLNTPPEKRKKRQTPPQRTVVPQETETTFTPVPTYNAAAAGPNPPAPSRSKRRRPRFIRDVPRCGSARLCPSPRRICRSTIRRPKFTRCLPSTRQGAALAPPGPQYYTYAISNFLPDYIINPPPPNLQPTEYLCARASAAALATDIGRARSLRGARHPRRFFHLAAVARRLDRRPPPIAERVPGGRRRFLHRRSAGTDCALRLGAPFAHRRLRRILDAVYAGSAAVAECSVHEFQGRRPHRRHARHPDQSAIARHHQHRQSGQPQQPIRVWRNCRSISTSVRPSASPSSSTA